MKLELDAKRGEVAHLCGKHRVTRLSVFGSAVTGAFREGRSDVDILVEFEQMLPVEHAAHFFGLQEDLEDLVGAPVDLVELKPIRNPFFRQAVEAG